ncbi:MAG: polysaccharide pyruvyl transferase CsaB [Jaaginema sp. PMC 1079.18]|nr:polysaccharide pyruvyl transferase CsaB [Jaaginema sp. PMC 1080.18]MEC4851588.1 polysaccharide pyruvyl transferase CsaB [Jaaginema sp. PMC 1079.18]MEC4864841.1 polysaccharide pyruvyl transferase CsaB [Jaaginema sp. PMC 1078.18]
MAKRAILCGYYGQGNGGDEALLATLLQQLPDNIQPIVLSGNPRETYERYRVESCDRKSAFPIIQALKGSDYFIWGGGSLMQDTTSILSPIYYAGLMALAQQQGLQTIAWAQGIGPLKRRFTQSLTQRVLAGCTAISVRDRASAELLKGWGLQPLLAPDPVWTLAPKVVPGLGDLPAPRIAVNLRSHSSLTSQRLQVLTTALVQLQKATQAYFLLVPFQLSQDLEIAQSIAAQLPGKYQVLQLTDPAELRGVYEGVEMAIGMRLHSLIMAAAARCRCWALSYDPKIEQLMADLDIPGWDLKSLPDDPVMMSKAWLEMYVNGESISRDRLLFLRDRALLHQELLSGTMSH